MAPPMVESIPDAIPLAIVVARLPAPPPRPLPTLSAERKNAAATGPRGVGVP